MGRSARAAQQRLNRVAARHDRDRLPAVDVREVLERSLEARGIEEGVDDLDLSNFAGTADFARDQQDSRRALEIRAPQSLAVTEAQVREGVEIPVPAADGGVL